MVTKKRALAAAAGLALTAMAGCTSSTNTSGTALENNDSANIEKTFLLNQPPPHFSHSDIRAAAISIEAIQALGEQTTSFGFNQGVKNPVWSCPSLGEPVAADTEITNPQQVDNDGYPQGGAAVPIGNMDPNGVYEGDTTGTYVVCVNAQGTQYTQYWEGFVDSVSGPATWDAATGQIVVTGQPTMPKCILTGVGTQKAATNCTK
jgi:hypothetical protein